jgi:hypothetical protein
MLLVLGVAVVVVVEFFLLRPCTATGATTRPWRRTTRATRATSSLIGTEQARCVPDKPYRSRIEKKIHFTEFELEIILDEERVINFVYLFVQTAACHALSGRREMLPAQPPARTLFASTAFST